MFYVMNETSIYCPIIVLKWSVSDEITISHINFDIKNSNRFIRSNKNKCVYKIMEESSKSESGK